MREVGDVDVEEKEWKGQTTGCVEEEKGEKRRGEESKGEKGRGGERRGEEEA